MNLRLTHTVNTLDNQVLFSKGSLLTTDTLETLLSTKKPTPYENFSFLKHGTVRRDLLKSIGRPPYATIFSDDKQTTEVLEIMEAIHLIPPLLESLDYFKQHDFITYRHILMVFVLSTIVAKFMMTEYEEHIHLAAMGCVHDIGKTCVPLEVLKKTTPLTKNELNILENHTIAGYTLLSYYFNDPRILGALIARDHHERRDGSGYPQGLMLGNEMIEIISVCDIYDALISPRPYRPVSYDNRTALEEIIYMAEQGRIGWNVVKALIALNRKAKPDHEDLDISSEKRGAPPSNNIYGVVIDENEELDA
jgi:HD-GYP domain-containing protein (c-di-GMP phosphodiesterase class II)